MQTKVNTWLMQVCNFVVEMTSIFNCKYIESSCHFQAQGQNTLLPALRHLVVKIVFNCTKIVYILDKFEHDSSHSCKPYFIHEKTESIR